MEFTVIIVSLLAGLLMGRWWSVALALPAGLLAAGLFSFEGFTGLEVGVLFGIVAALGLVVGTAARKGIGLVAGSQQRRR